MFFNSEIYNNLNFKQQVDRTGKQCQVVPVKVSKDTTWQDKILMDCIDGLERDNIPDVKVRDNIISYTYINMFLFSIH